MTFASNIAQCGHHLGQQIQVKTCSQQVCTCSTHFREHLFLDEMLSNLVTMLANNSTQSGNSGGRNMRKSVGPINTSTSSAAKWRLNQRRKG